MPVLASTKHLFQHVLARLLGNDLVVCIDCRTLLKRWASCPCETCNADLCDCEGHYTFDGYRYVASCRACADWSALQRRNVNMKTDATSGLSLGTSSLSRAHDV